MFYKIPTQIARLLSSKNWVGIAALATILLSPFWSKLFENDNPNVHLYELTWNRIESPHSDITTEKLGKIKADLLYQIEYVLLNAGSRPVDLGDYIDPLAIRSKDEVYILYVGSHLIDSEKSVKWNPSDDGMYWRMTPEFLNPGDRLLITVGAATANKKDKWLSKNIGEAIEWSGRLRGQKIPSPEIIGGQVSTNFIMWNLFGFASSYDQSGIITFLVLFLGFYFLFMWISFQTVMRIKSTARKIIYIFILFSASFCAADGTHYILFPRYMDGGRFILANWLCLFAPILVVGVLYYFSKKKRIPYKA